MTNDAIVAVIQRNAFYRRLHYYALAALFVAIIVIGVMIGVLYYISGNINQPLYFATDSVGRLMKMTPVSEPNMSDDDVVAWAKTAVQAAYSYNYVNYREQLQGAQKYFTDYGWTKYMDALTASNNLVAVDKRKMISVATVVDNATILQKGRLPSGAYAWRIQMPVLETYWLPPYDNNSRFNNPVTVTLIVQRRPVLESNSGLGIVQLIGEIASAPIANSQAPVSTTPAS